MMLSASIGGIEIARDIKMPDGRDPVTAIDAIIAVNNMIGVPLALPVPTHHGEELSLASNPIIKVVSKLSDAGLARPHDPRTVKIPCQSIFREFLAAVRAGVAAEYYPVGAVLYAPHRPELPAEYWTRPYRPNDSHAMPFIVVDYRMAELPNHEKCLATVLLSLYAIDHTTVFGRPVPLSNIETMFCDSRIVQDMNRWRRIYYPDVHSSLREVAAKVLVDQAEVQFFPPSL